MVETASKTNWKQVHLRENAGMLIPASNDFDEVALLTARTLLAYLMDINKLSYEVLNDNNCSMVIVRNKDSGYNLSDGLLDEMWGTLCDPAEDTQAVVMVRPFEPVAEQPALAFLKADAETINLFNKVWLKSSLSWLRKNPQDRVVLDLTFKK